MTTKLRSQRKQTFFLKGNRWACYNALSNFDIISLYHSRASVIQNYRGLQNERFTQFRVIESALKNQQQEEKKRKYKMFAMLCIWGAIATPFQYRTDHLEMFWLQASLRLDKSSSSSFRCLQSWSLLQSGTYFIPLWRRSFALSIVGSVLNTA